jgi:hypothetical protein
MADMSQSMHVRFYAREDHDGWMVFDVLAGRPADIVGVIQVELAIEDAAELAELLNYHYSLDAGSE